VATSFKHIVIDEIYPKALVLGHLSGCHQIDERSFHYGFRKYPLCARCSGVAVIFFPSIAVLLFVGSLSIMAAIILMVPLMVDGFTQLFTDYESTNIVRFSTGLLFGAGWASMVLSSIYFYMQL